MNNEEYKIEETIIKGLIKDGKTQPIVDYKECIFEKVYVETSVDTDEDGKLDLIAVYIRRPKETLKGYKVPAIYVANPYMMTCNEELYIPHDVDRDIEKFTNQNIKKDDVSFDFKKEVKVKIIEKRETLGYRETNEVEEVELDCIPSWYSYYNSRGYASIFCGGLGTLESEGVTLTGSREEIEAFKSVIDWLCGKCRAFTNRTDNIEIKATWCSGKVAMSGKSYLGTMCIGVATTGVEGLKTIIPEAAISNWYGYYRYNGLNLPALDWQGDDLDILSKYCCSRIKDKSDFIKVKEIYEKKLEQLIDGQDRKSGNYNYFWDERNYLNLIKNIKASVFIVHGLNDWNVKMNQCIPFWNELNKHSITSKMILHQGEHIYIHNLENSFFNEIMHEWLDYYLYNIENGVLDKVPNVLVESNLNPNRWIESKTWPEKESINTLFHTYSSNGILRLRETSKNKEKNILKNQIVNFKDDVLLMDYSREDKKIDKWREELILNDNKSYSINYISEPLEEEIRICGTIKVSLEISVDKEVGILSGMLVDCGEDYRLGLKPEIIEEKGIVWGKNTPKEDKIQFVFEKIPSLFRVISRGWINIQNRMSNYSKIEIKAQKFYNYSFDMIPMDYTLKKGRCLKFIIYGSDLEQTQRPFSITNFNIKENSINIQIPIVK